jgi:hypothetical protein
MTAKKKAAPKPEPKPTLKPRLGKKPVPPRDSFGASVAAHMQGHPEAASANPWANMNAGGVCGVCGQRVK